MLVMCQSKSNSLNLDYKLILKYRYIKFISTMPKLAEIFNVSNMPLIDSNKEYESMLPKKQYKRFKQTIASLITKVRK